jgi:hypothetical protein
MESKSAAESASESQASQQFVRIVTVPSGTVIAFKLFPASCNPFSHEEHESTSMWSAFYGQFSVVNAVRYLGNHYDRGHREVILYAIRTNQEVSAILYTNPLMQQSCSSRDKAVILRDDLNKSVYLQSLMSEGALLEVGENESIVSQIGRLFNAVLVLFDAEDLEIAFPHKFFSEVNFSIVPIFTITRGDSSMLTESVFQHEASDFGATAREVQLRKSQKQDTVELAHCISDAFPSTCNSCTWKDNFL